MNFPPLFSPRDLDREVAREAARREADALRAEIERRTSNVRCLGRIVANLQAKEA